MHKGHYLSICIIVINIMFSSCEESGTENQITNLDTTVINSLMDIYDIEDGPGAALLITKLNFFLVLLSMVMKTES